MVEMTSYYLLIIKDYKQKVYLKYGSLLEPFFILKSLLKQLHFYILPKTESKEIMSVFDPVSR